jgi:hypothetical protein
MKVETRKTHDFIEIKVDRLEDTIFKTDRAEISQTIDNLLDVVRDLMSYTDVNLKEYINSIED